MKFLESLLEGSLWNSRFVIFLAVLGSLFASFAIFYMATVDVVMLMQHTVHYADASLTDEARKVLHDCYGVAHRRSGRWLSVGGGAADFLAGLV